MPGTIFGMLFVVLSLTPSLLPRPAWGQGLVSGLAFGLGYALGLALWRVVGIWWPGTMRTVRRFRSWVALVVALVIALIFAPIAIEWQNSVRAHVGIGRISGVEWFVFVVVFGLSLMLAFAIGRGLRRLYAWTRRRTARWAQGTTASNATSAPHRKRGILVGLTATVAIVALGMVATGVTVWIVAEQLYNIRNSNYDPAYAQPTSPLRSGSPESLVEWDDIGQAGVKVVSGGPTVQMIEAITGGAAIEPIRVYVGMDSPGGAAEHAALAVQELERTNAQERDVVVLAATTGTGWLDAAAIDGVEYLHRGNTALVTIQYGATPSPVSAILTPEVSQEAAQASYAAVYDWWSALPESTRPQLMVYGLSLGSFAMNSVFATPQAIFAGTEGAILEGTPSFSPLWQHFEDNRDEGSPYSLPVIDGGEKVRFGSQWGDLAAVAPQWQEPRIVYLQHGTDPVVWIGPSVIWAEPEWLKPGQRSPDVSSSMFWIPVVTAVQGVVDLITSTAVPENAGHKYGTISLDAFHEVTGDAGLTDAQLSLIYEVIEDYDTYSPVAN